LGAILDFRRKQFLWLGGIVSFGYYNKLSQNFMFQTIQIYYLAILKGSILKIFSSA
jgi:hypothetical protein